MGKFSLYRTISPTIKEYFEIVGNEMTDIIAFIEAPIPDGLGLTEADILGGYSLSTPTSIVLEDRTDALSTIQDIKQPIPLLNEESRDAYFTSPTIGDSYYSARLSGIREWYYSISLDLWLNTHTRPFLNSNSVNINRIVYIDGDDVFSGREYPTAQYPSNAGERRRGFGVTIENGANNFISVASSGEYYVDAAVIITAGQIIRPDTNGRALGFSGSTVGGIGYALEDSGATVLGKVLIKIGYNT